MTISKNKKLKQKILDAISGKAELSTDRGVFDRSKSVKSNAKVRRHSGWKNPLIVDKSMKYSDIIEQCLEPQLYYDDWSNYRDGFRDDTKIDKPQIFHYEEDKKIAIEKNRMIKKQLAIRQAKKIKSLLKGETSLSEID